MYKNIIFPQSTTAFQYT